MDAVKLKIELFKKLTEEHGQANYRRAGLVGLSAIGIGLYQKNVRSTNPLDYFVAESPISG